MGANILPLAEAIPMIRNHADDFRSHDVFLYSKGLLDTGHLKPQNARATKQLGHSSSRPPLGRSLCPGRLDPAQR